ncbi:hypothetical protein Tco_1514171 [Tanacetum coccineum]
MCVTNAQDDRAILWARVSTLDKERQYHRSMDIAAEQEATQDDVDSKCTVKCHVKFATCTLLGSALTWWNPHVRTVRHDATYALPWKTLMKMMTENYCLRSEIKKLEI